MTLKYKQYEAFRAQADDAGIDLSSIAAGTAGGKFCELCKIILDGFGVSEFVGESSSIEERKASYLFQIATFVGASVDPASSQIERQINAAKAYLDELEIPYTITAGASQDWRLLELLLAFEFGPAAQSNLIQWLYTTDDGVDVDDKIGTFSKPDYTGVGGLAFDGVDSVIKHGIITGATDEIVLSSWVVIDKTYLATANAVINGNFIADGIMIDVVGGNIRGVANTSSGNTISTLAVASLTDGVYLISATITGGFITVSVGAQSGTVIACTGVTEFTSEFKVGASSAASYGRGFAGTIGTTCLTSNGVNLLNASLQEDSGSTAFDASGQGNDGTISGGATWTTVAGIPSAQANGFYVATQGVAPYITSLEFKSRSIATLDGVADTIDFGTHDITSWNTFYSQGYFRSTSSVRGIIVSVIHSGADDIRIQLESTGKFRFALDDGTVKSVLTAGAYNDGEWHFYSAYFTGTTMSLMVDAETVYNYTADFDFAGASGAISVGSRSGSSVFFDGELDNTRIGGGVDEINLIVKDPFIVTGKASTIAPNPEGSGGNGIIAPGAGGYDTFWGQRIEDAVDGIWVASNYELLTNPSCVLYNLVHNGGSYTITQTDTDYINGTANRWSDGAAFYDLTFAQHQAHVNGLYGSWTKNVTIDGRVYPSEDGQYVIDVAGGAPYDFDWVPETIYEYNQNVAYWTEGAGDSIEPEYDLDGTLQINLDGSIEYVLPA